MTTFTRQQKRKLCKAIARFQITIEDRLAIRQQTAKLIEERKAGDGKVYVEVWQRDCDLMEVSEVRTIESCVMAFEKLANGIYDNAEGPVRITIMRPADLKDWQPIYRDLAAEMAGY